MPSTLQPALESSNPGEQTSNYVCLAVNECYSLSCALAIVDTTEVIQLLRCGLNAEVGG